MPLTTVNQGLLGTYAQYTGFKNRLINGDMRIDQRNNGASVTPTASAYTLDRWQANITQSSKFSVQQNAGSVTPPTGFTNYLGCTSLSAYSVLSTDAFSVNQYIEGLNVSDLGWGTANAQTVTLSFWVRSSLTGTFGGSVVNSAVNRSYPFTYTISAANTWELETVTIPGDTAGTWLTTNGVGIRVFFGLGVGATFSGTAGAWAGSDFRSATGATSLVGTNGATFYITGVQLEAGSTATSFDRRDYGRELMMCQRYFYRIAVPSGGNAGYLGLIGSFTSTRCLGAPISIPVSMRVDAASISVSVSNASLYAMNLSVSYSITSISAWSGNGTTVSLDIGVASGLTANTAYIFTVLAGGNISYSAEL